MKAIRIMGDNIVLRELRMRDAGLIAKYLKGKEVKKYTSTIPHPYSEKDAVSFIKKTAKEQKEKKSVRLAIDINGQLAGIISLERISPEHKTAEVGYWLAKEHWGKGIMTEAVSLIKKYAFKELKLYRLHAKVMAPNIGSARVLKKSGFENEGLLKGHFVKFGKRYDVFYFGIIKSKP